jgi:hypothetical protein
MSEEKETTFEERKAKVDSLIQHLKDEGHLKTPEQPKPLKCPACGGEKFNQVGFGKLCSDCGTKIHLY